MLAGSAAGRRVAVLGKGWWKPFVMLCARPRGADLPTCDSRGHRVVRGHQPRTSAREEEDEEGEEEEEITVS